MKKQTLVMGIAAAAAVLAAAVPASADWKSLPGLSCVKQGTAGTLSVTTTGAASNAATTVLKLYCPLVRDESTWDTDDVRLTVVDANGGALAANNFACRVVAQDDDTISWTPTSNKSNATSASTAAQQINVPVNIGYAYGAYFIDCSVPGAGSLGASSVINYAWNET